MIQSYALMGAVAALVAGVRALRPAPDCDVAAKPSTRSGFRDPLAHRLDCHWRDGYYVG